MPAATPAKRALAEATKNGANVQSSPRSVKKPKLEHTMNKDGRLPVKFANGSFNSSQPKSQFEEEVLEKMTQDMETLKHNNAEKDQQWSRPPLGDFNETRDNICFQQIEAEEGVLNGGRATVKLFGVTQVSWLIPSILTILTVLHVDRPLRPSPRHKLCPLLLRRCTCRFR